MNPDAASPEPTRRQWVGYWSMIVQQTQNAFNDKMAQFILIPLGGAVGLAVESWAGLMIALPFVLFAPLAGWLSDRFSKRDVILGSAVLQMVVLFWICGAVYMKNLPLALCGFFALAVQSAFFSPAKIGINKELVGSRHLGFAAGIQQMMAMLAILAGQIVAGWIFDRRLQSFSGQADAAWSAALLPLLVLALLAVPALALAWIIPKVPAQGTEKFTAKLAISHFASLKELWADLGLRRASFGVAFFWGFAAFINLWSVKVARFLTGGGEGFGTMSSMFMAAASLGMAAGFGGASMLLRKNIELGWVPVAGVAMTIMSTVIVFVPLDGTVFLVALGLLAFFSALFLSPLNAWMQDRYPPEKRGDLQAAVNLQDCFAGILAVAIIIVFELITNRMGVDPLTGCKFQMGFVALSCLVATAYIIRLLPAAFIRLVGVTVIRSIYKIRRIHAERMPETGGVLLLPNHVTYADAFFISAASPRPVRFVMDEAFIAHRAIRIFTGIFETVTIRRDQPLEAIREIIRSLKTGEVLCFFPEGQLTRTGTLCTLQRGFELIAKKAGHPLVPLWCDGSWGSIFSFEGNRYFHKVPRRMPHGITFAFGQEIQPRDATMETVRHGLHLASAEAIASHYNHSSREWAARRPKATHLVAAAFCEMDENARRHAWVNGHQIGCVNAIPRRMPIHVLEGDPLIVRLPGLLVAFAELHDCELIFEPHFSGDKAATWIGGDMLRTAIQTSQIMAEISFHHFGEKALKPMERAGLGHHPGLEVNGIVVSMSMAHPPASKESFEPQHGHKLGSWGKLLPGWYLMRHDDGSLQAHGPAAPEEGLPLPAGCTMDAEGFLVTPPRKMLR